MSPPANFISVGADESLFRVVHRCDERGLLDSLITRTIKSVNDLITKTLDPEAASINRDTLAKTVYSRLFDWYCTSMPTSLDLLYRRK